jgi:type III restriction enzyme
MIALANYGGGRILIGFVGQPLAEAEGEPADLDAAWNTDRFNNAVGSYLDPPVRFWVSNVAHHPHSFWLPTASDKFYPDFVAMLDDGRTLVVEYKGGHLADGVDTNEKRLIGELWERQRQGRALFIVVEKVMAGKDMRGQMMNKIGA